MTRIPAGCFECTEKDCSSLTSVSIPNGVTSIGFAAFAGCNSLTFVSIPNSVTSIGDYAFGFNESQIPDNGYSHLCIEAYNPMPVDISKLVFSNRTDVTLYVINEDAYKAANYWKKFEVQSIPSSSTISFLDANVKAICVAHWDTDHDGEISLSEAAAVTSLSDCFKNNTTITSFIELTYFGNLTSINNEAFAGCSGLTSIRIPSGATSIGNNAFSGCSVLTSVSIPSSVTSIGNQAFQNCTDLNYITIPNGVTTINEEAFLGSGLSRITIPASVTTIGDNAFNCPDLTNIYVDSYNAHYDSRNNSNAIIKTLDNKLIRGCRNTIIPNTVTSIGDNAFSNCSDLTSISIPSSVTSIGDNAFSNCSSLTAVTVLNPSPVVITENVFSNRANATLLVPDGCKEAYEAADYWKEFKEIVTPNITFADSNVKNICVTHWDSNHDGGISDAEAAAVTSLSDYFSNNSSITSFDELAYFTGLTSIGEGTFGGCSSLASITIPVGVTSIGNNAFSNCSSLTSLKVESGNAIYDSRNNCKAIIKTATNELVAGCNSTTIPNSVTTIGEGAFAGSGLTSIAIPNSVTSIGRQAFKNCIGLTAITIPSSITSIGEEGFAGSGLTSIAIPTNVTSIGNQAFYGCTGLISVTVSNPVPIAITEGVFSNRASKTLYVPIGSESAYGAANFWNDFQIDPTIIVFADANVKAICVAHWDTDHDGEISITEAAAVTTLSNYFQDRISITSFDELVYFTGLTSIGSSAFQECSSLASITIPASVTSIKYQAFALCTGLTSITISANLTSIGEAAFYGCSGLSTITIPTSVTTIDTYAFAGCSSLASIVVEFGNTSFDSRDNCNAIIEKETNKLIVGCRSTIIPNNVTSIGYGAFAECNGLTSITIPSSVTSIVSAAFAECSSLTSITIPAGVTSIGSYAFGGCSSLKWVRLMRSESVTELTNTIVFKGCSSLSLIIVPENAGYETADKWSSFAAKMRTDKVTIFENNAPNTLMSWCDKFEYTKPEGCTVYEIGGVTGNQVNLTPIDGEVIPAYTPVIIQRTEGSLDAPIKAEINDIADGGDLVSTTAEGATLYGNTTEATITTGDFYAAGRSYVLYPGNKFLRVDTNEGIPAHRCMLTLSSPAATRSLSIGLGGDTTGMDEPKNERTEEQEANNTWYDLQGRPIGGKPSVKGIYIYKGKKLVVK